MKIKYTPKKNSLKTILMHCRQGLKTKIGIIALAAAVTLLFGFIALKKIGAIEKITRVLPYIYHGYFINPPERLIIDMKFKHYQKLADKAKEAVDFGFLVKEADDEVPAYVSYKGKKVRVKTRLKGGMSRDHLSGRKWSMRIQVKDDETIMGMKQFSIQRPITRWYLNEWIYHYILRAEDIMTLRYDFVNVTLNGKNMGLYAVEEHFSKELIENNRHREGLIIRWDDEDSFLNMAHQNKSSLAAGAYSIGYFSSPVRTYGLNKGSNAESKMEQFKTAMELYARLRNNEITLTQAYDLRKMARYFALNDLLGARHGSLYPNFVTYYNPITSKLEPVGFDTEDALHSVKILSGERFMKLYEERIEERTPSLMHQEIFWFWQDREFTEEYLRELERVSSQEYIDHLIEALRAPAKDAIGHLWHLGIEGLRSQSFKFVENQLRLNAKVIREKFKHLKGVYAYFVESDNQNITLKLGNPETIPIEILHISRNDEPIAVFNKATHLPARKFYSPIEFQEFKFSVKPKFPFDKSFLPQLKIVYKIPGTSYIKNQPIFSWNILDDLFFARDLMRKKANFRNFSFLSVNDRAKTIAINRGQWEIKENMVIPPGWTVYAKPNTTLDLKNSAKIITHSPLQFIGDEIDPIRIISSDGTGEGLAVIDAKGPSMLQHVTFRNLSNPRAGGWALTGAVTFYQSPVKMEHCHFLSIKAEDSLNIVRSDFSIDSAFLKNSQYDAIDIDFAKGTISNSSFYNSGNDAIDLSGSMVELSDIFINKTGDKGISIGEASEVKLRKIEVRDALIAIANKDSSKATASGISIRDAKQAIALYQKKPEFGPSRMTVEEIGLKAVDRAYSVEKGSSLSVNGKLIKDGR